jgi:hypothetical protein
MRTLQRGALIVAGDLNDGPGLDDYERFSGARAWRSCMGGPGEVRLYDPHAETALQSRIAAQPTTARFFIAHRTLALGPARLHHGQPRLAPRWRGAGASGIRSTTPNAGPIRSCATRCSTRRTISP